MRCNPVCLLFILHILFTGFPEAYAQIGQISHDPGFVIYRDDSLSGDEHARLFEYNSLIDRSASSGAGLGYMIFLGEGGKVKCNSSSVVTTFTRKDLVPSSLSTPDEINSYKALYEQVYQASRINQIVANQAEPLLSLMANTLRKIDQGEILQNGKWVTAYDRIREKHEAEKLAEKENISQQIKELKNHISESADAKTLKTELDALKSKSICFHENSSAIADSMPELERMISDASVREEKKMIEDKVKVLKSHIETSANIESLKTENELLKALKLSNQENQKLLSVFLLDIDQLINTKEKIQKNKNAIIEIAPSFSDVGTNSLAHEPSSETSSEKEELSYIKKMIREYDLETFTRIKKDAESGSPQAKWIVAESMWDGMNGLKKDRILATGYLIQAADSGHRYALLDLGCRYNSTYKQLKKDDPNYENDKLRDEAYDLLRRAAVMGSAIAKNVLATDFPEKNHDSVISPLRVQASDRIGGNSSFNDLTPETKSHLSAFFSGLEEWSRRQFVGTSYSNESASGLVEDAIKGTMMAEAMMPNDVSHEGGRGEYYKQYLIGDLRRMGGKRPSGGNW